jgi:two-component system OmpR family response regulator
MKILVAEDEHRIAQAIREGLEQESYAVDMVFDGEEAYSSARYEDYDLLILDVMMPGLTGFEVASKLRQEGKHVPILILTAKDQSRDIVHGLDSGADDYLAKPFSFEVLLARIRALLRRPEHTVGEVLTAKDLSLNPVSHEVKRGKTPIHLSGKEYALLEYLLRNKGRVLSKDNLIAHVWDFDANILPNNVEVFIAYLRNKIDKPFKQDPIIETVRGFGYKVAAG